MPGQPVLVIVSEDPRVSHRANEAIRIAVGVVAGDTPVDVVLTGAGVHLLDADTDDLVDGDDIAKFRATLKRLNVPVHVDASAMPADPDWNADGHRVIPATPETIASLAAKATRFIVF